MSNITLRPYQQDFINDVRERFKAKKRHVVGVAPCGSGKTIMTGWMIRESAKRGRRSIFFVHRRELIRQTSLAFTQLGIEHGIIDSKSPMQLDLPVQIASVQTLARRIDKIPAPDFLVCDECHHILAGTYKKILAHCPNAYLLGVTATPLRMGGVTLNDAFDSMVESLSVNELIKLGNLTRFKYFAPLHDIDLSAVRSKFGEFNQDDLANVMMDNAVVGDVVGKYCELALGKSAICYCVNVAHSIEVAKSFNAAGIPAAHCDGETPQSDRDIIVDEFRRGNIKVLCNAELFGEGFDVPNMQAVILARPTQSLTLFIQQSMRPLRPDPNDPNKVAIIIDHVKNYKRHGFPNTHHEWSLDPNTEHFTKCPFCDEWIKPRHVKGKRICPECGKELPSGKTERVGSRERKTVDGDLVQLHVDFDSVPKPNETAIKEKPTTPEELLAAAKRKGYKTGWVAFQSMKYAVSYEDFKHIADVCGYKRGWAHHKWQDFQTKIACKEPA